MTLHKRGAFKKVQGGVSAMKQKKEEMYHSTGLERIQKESTEGMKTAGTKMNQEETCELSASCYISEPSGFRHIVCWAPSAGA